MLSPLICFWEVFKALPKRIPKNNVLGELRSTANIAIRPPPPSPSYAGMICHVFIPMWPGEGSRMQRQHYRMQLDCPIFALGAMVSHKHCASQYAQCHDIVPFFLAARKWPSPQSNLVKGGVHMRLQTSLTRRFEKR